MAIYNKSMLNVLLKSWIFNHGQTTVLVGSQNEKNFCTDNESYAKVLPMKFENASINKKTHAAVYS